MKTEFWPGFLSYQEDWLRDGSRFKIGLWARQTGKDFTCAAEAVLDCARTQRTHWLMLACGERQARESLEKAREFARAMEESQTDCLRYMGAAENARGAGAATSIKRESATEIRFSNGSRITALPARKETIRGYSANLILTEFAFHEDPEGIWKAIFPSVSNSLRGGLKKVRIISTPNGQGNYFHELWLNSKAFARYKVTIHDAVKAGLPMDAEELRAGMPDAEAWAQEYECEFADQSAVLLPYELIEGCEAPEANQTNSVEGLSHSFDANYHQTPELYLGIDFGRKQDLTVCWVLEKLPNNLILNGNISRNLSSPSSSGPTPLAALNKSFITREVLVLQRTPTPAQIEALRPRARLARRVCIDYTGAGIGLGDALAQEFGRAVDVKDWRGKVELCTFTAGLKEEIFVKLRAAMERRSVWIPRSTEIREDLHSMHRVVSQHGHIAFRATRSADGHSDRCTALALALRAAESAPVVYPAKSIGQKFAMLRC